MVTKFYDLTEQAMAEIMSWLPPECLVQCKCVQKSWHFRICALIKTRWFVTKHLENYGSRSSFVFFMGVLSPFSKIITETRVVNSYNICNKNEIQFDSIELSSTSSPKDVMAYYSITHCNGIICMADFVSKKISLCNPTTREFKYLDMDSSCVFGFRYQQFLVGFGYDAIADVYKVVRVVRQNAVYVAEVCTLGSANTIDSSWRRISMINMGNYLKIYPSRGLYYKGFIYWVVCSLKNVLDEKMIISFDTHTEEFQTVPLPTSHVPADGHNNVSTSNIGLWLDFRNECITFLQFSSEVEMWTMKTDSSTSSFGHERFFLWVKHPSFPPPPLPKYRPKLFLSSDELIMTTNEMGHPISYNIHTHEVRAVRLCPGKLYHSNLFIPYVKGLVSLNNF